MILSSGHTDYEILDTGDGMKLERWGSFILSRPDPQVIWPKNNPDAWGIAQAHYIRSDVGGGKWTYYAKLPDRWEFSYKNIKMHVHPTGFKHTGVFPEQSANWDYIMGKIKPGMKMLNLFAYTGGATLAGALAGASVTHVDAAKSMVGWAKENALLCGVKDKIRFMTDDCLKFVKRERRRGNRYNLIIMDPPSFGRGSDGQLWKIEDHLYELVEECAKLLTEDAISFIINSYTTGLSSLVTSNIMLNCLGRGNVESHDLALPITDCKLVLPCGTTSRWTP